MLRDAGDDEGKDRRDAQHLEEPEHTVRPDRVRHAEEGQAHRRRREKKHDEPAFGDELAEPRRREGPERCGRAGREDQEATDLQRPRGRDAEVGKDLGQDRGEEEHLRRAREHDQRDPGHVAHARRALRRARLGRLGLRGHPPFHERRARPQDRAAKHEGRAEADPRRGDRAPERADDLAHGHGGLHGRHPPAHGLALGDASRHDEGEGGRRAHEAEDEAREEQLGERARRRHPEEAQALQHLDDDIERFRIAAGGEAAPDGRRHDRDERRDP